MLKALKHSILSFKVGATFLKYETFSTYHNVMVYILVSSKSNQEYRGKFRFNENSIGLFYTCITQRTGPTALRPIRRSQQNTSKHSITEEINRHKTQIEFSLESHLIISMHPGVNSEEKQHENTEASHR